MLIKSCAVKIKAAGTQDGLDDGQFEAIVSVFGNKDSYGDVVMPGAFKDTLVEWAASGDPIPVYWSHRMDDPDFNIGHVLDAKEIDEGLWIKAQLDLEPGAGKAAQVHRLLKGRRVTQFSFAYDVLDGGWAKTTDAAGTEDEFYELRRLKLYEVGPTPIGANQETELLGVKHLADGLTRTVKAGRVLSAKNESSIREARDALNSVLSALDTTDDDQEKNAQPAGPATDEEPSGAKSKEPSSTRPADPVLVLIDIAERN